MQGEAKAEEVRGRIREMRYGRRKYGLGIRKAKAN